MGKLFSPEVLKRDLPFKIRINWFEALLIVPQSFVLLLKQMKIFLVITNVWIECLDNLNECF